MLMNVKLALHIHKMSSTCERLGRLGEIARPTTRCASVYGSRSVSKKHPTVDEPNRDDRTTMMMMMLMMMMLLSVELWSGVVWCRFIQRNQGLNVCKMVDLCPPLHPGHLNGVLAQPPGGDT